MRIISLTLFGLFIFNQINAQNNWYVNYSIGNDNNNGTSENSPFKTVEYVADNILQPGDTLFIIGEYVNSSYNPNYVYNAENDIHLWHAENTISINNLHGTPSNYITIKAYTNDPLNPTIIKGDGANVFRVRNSSYLRIEGLEIMGEVNNIPMSTANALQFVYIDADNLTGTEYAPNISDIKYRDQEGSIPNVIDENEVYPDLSFVNVKRPSYVDTRGMYVSNNVHHLEIVNNLIHHTPGNGLRISGGKYFTISGNEVHNCSRRSYSGTHGFVVTKTEPTLNENDTSIYIHSNNIHHNYNEQFSWAPTKTIITPIIDEGKGISLQRNNTPEWISGNGRILVENNLCYWNGFSGVHSNDGFKIDFINNTSFMNSYTNTVTYANTTQQGKNIGISASGGDDIKMINNISVIDATWGGYAISTTPDIDTLEVENNVIYGVNDTLQFDSDVINTEVNTIIADPLFVDAPFTWNNSSYNFDFNVLSSSVVIDGANHNYAPITDYFGNNRDLSPDIGAIEFIEDVTNVVPISDKGNVSIYPNPGKDLIRISTNNLIEEVKITNMNGQIVMKSNNEQIDISILKPGIYQVIISTQEDVFVKPLVKL